MNNEKWGYAAKLLLLNKTGEAVFEIFHYSFFISAPQAP
jgi:hypothetical protein